MYSKTLLVRSSDRAVLALQAAEDVVHEARQRATASAATVTSLQVH